MTDVVAVIDFTAADEVDIAHEPDEAFTRFGRPLNGPNQRRDLPEFRELAEVFEPCCFDMAMDAVASVLPTCDGPGNPPRFPPVCSGDCLIQRPDRNDPYCKTHAA